MASTTDVSSGTALAEEDRPKQKPRCRLLELPEELQLVIYELVVISDHTIILDDLDCCGFGDDERPSNDENQWLREGMQPEISKTCRSIRSIALPVYYKRNVFEFCYCSLGYESLLRRTKHWLDDIGASNRALLATLRYHEWDIEPSANRTRSVPKALQSLGPRISTLESQHINSLKFNRYQLNFTQ
ncbi:hypothetical protein LTS10_000191 [Elasticomyces elasticus]|nr:hypothetical protein LTS10_000191 [Elasticomyces elasticus]